MYFAVNTHSGACGQSFIRIPKREGIASAAPLGTLWFIRHFAIPREQLRDLLYDKKNHILCYKLARRAHPERHQIEELLMRLTKPTTNAVKVLVHLARSPDETMLVSALAQACGITEKTAFKLVPLLVREGFAQTERGRSGGVKLARPAETISIGEIVRALEQAPASGVAEGSVRQQTLSLVVDEAYDGFLQILDQHSIADFMRKQSDGVSESARSDLGFVC